MSAGRGKYHQSVPLQSPHSNKQNTVQVRPRGGVLYTEHHKGKVKEKPAGGEDVQEQPQWTDGSRHHPQIGLTQVEVRLD